MPQVLKEVVRTNIYGTEVWVTDKTGAYSALNTGGWGTPNPSLANSALLCLVKHVDEADTYLTPITNQIAHNPGADDDFENSFGFSFYKDGMHSATIIRLRVSEDGGETDLDEVGIDNGVYFVIGDTLYLRQEGANLLIEPADYYLLLAEDDLTKKTCELMFYNKLLIKVRDYYKQYKDLRLTACEDAREWLQKHDELKADIAGAEYNFRSGLKVDAQETIKQLLSLHGIS